MENVTERKGFKGFNEDMTNRYGQKFEEGKTYHTDEEIGFGNDKYGFHFCEKIEDVFRYFDPENIKIARVTATGNMVEGFDDYNEYYDMYSAETIHIDHILSREEIVLEILSGSPLRVCRFLSTGFKLNSEEEMLFRSKFANDGLVNTFLDFYVREDKDAFKKWCKVM
jgi:hypothetical protein